MTHKLDTPENCLERAKTQAKRCLDNDNYQGARNWLAEVIKQDAIIQRRDMRINNMADKHVTTTPAGKRFEWTVESFNLRTGNYSQLFRPNHYQAPDFIVESK